jgi:adhesin/invasin
VGWRAFPSEGQSLRRIVGGSVAFVALAAAGKACSDLTAPAGVNDVAVQFELDPGATRLDLIVGDSVRPGVTVTLGGIEQSRARYVFTSSDPSIIRVYANGDSIVADDRGTATLIATLVGTTIGNNRINPNSRTADTIVVAAAALTNVVSPTALSFSAIGERQTVVARSIGRGGRVIVGSEIQWRAAAPGVVSVAPLTDSTAEVTAIGNGGPVDIWAIFRGVDSVSTSAIVAQRFSPTGSVVVPGATALPADGTSATSVTVYVRDANGNNLSSGGANVVVSLAPANGTLTPQTATDNGDGSYSATYIAGTTSGNVIISATVNGVSVANSGIVTLTSGVASQYIVNASSLQPVAGSPVTITARLADGNGNSVPQAGQTVTWSSTGGGSFSAATSTTDASGVATVTFTTSSSITQHTVTATTGTITGTSQLIMTQAGPPTSVAVTAASTSPVAGSQVQISAQLLDASGNAVPVAGQSVTWTKSDANGALSSATSVTNGAGIATVMLTTHTVSGTSTTVTATSGAISGTSATITTVAGPASQLTLTQMPSPTAQSGVAFAQQPVLQLRDAQGNAVAQANVSVNATITAGGGTLGGVTLVQTDANGVATFTDLSLAGNSGGRTLTFSASGVSSATAGVTIGAGTASHIALQAGAGQSATAGTAVAVAPSVIVRDASNNPVAGVNVTFAVTSGGGSTVPVSGNTVATDAAGIAALTSWTLGTTAGMNTLTASVAGLSGSPVTFTATGTTGPATQMTTTVGAQTATVNTPVSTDPWVIVRDANNNPVSGVSVTFAVTGGGGSISSPTGNTVVTNASGVAALSSWTLGTTAGANAIQATAAGLPTVTFTATGTAGAAVSISVNAGNGQSATVGTAVAVEPSVSVRDAYNNPVALVNVVFTITGGGGSTLPASPATRQTAASGVASLESWTLGTATGANTITASAAGLIGDPVTFTATGTPAVVNAATSSVLRTGSNNVAANGASTSEITVTLRDQYGNAVPGKAVSLAPNSATTVISAPGGSVSNLLGEVRFIVSNTAIETVTYSASANDPAAIALGSVDVTFVAGSIFMIAQTGTSQNAVIGTAVTAPPAVLVRDEANNPVAGVNVTFSLTANGGGGGAISPASPATVTTDAAGIAALASWTLGQTAGTNNNSVVANAPGVLGSPVTFMASGDNPDPDLTAIAPTSGVQGQTMSMVFTGTGFVPTATVSFSGSGITVNSTTVNSSTQITANITISTTANVGTRNARVTNPSPGGGSSSDRLFTITVPAVPTLTGLAPANAARGQTLDVVFTGTGFAQGVSSVNVPAGFTVNTVTVTSGTQLTANITVGAAVAYGAVHNFTVTNTPAGGTSGPQVFTVDHPVPTLTAIAPATGQVLQTLNLVFTGTEFISGVTTVNVPAGFTLNSVTVDSPTQITANVTVTAAAATGAHNFSVTNPAPGGGTSATQSFTVSNPAPTVTLLNPATAARLQTLNVDVTGTGFIAGVTTVTAGPNVSVNSVTVNSATSLTANITIDRLASTGIRNFSVTNPAPGGGTASQPLTVSNPAPTLSGISPTSGVQGSDDMQIVLTGTGFVPGSTVTFTPNTGITINSTTVNSATQITLSVDIAALAPAGNVDINVVNAAPGGGTSGAQTFSINAPPAPSLTGIAPAAGDRLQTLDVVFTGTNFVNGVTSVTVPAGFTLNSVTVDSPTQLTANISIGNAAPLGGANSFTVTNSPPGGTSAAQTFTVSNPAPSITSVTPNDVTVGLVGTTVASTTILGTGFVSGTLVDFVQGDVTITGTVTVVGPNQITVTNINYPGVLLLPETRAIRVTNPGRPAVTSNITIR